MGSGHGEEHGQHDAIAALFAGKKIPRPDEWLIDDHGTPNQRMQGAALRLGWERRFGTPAGLEAAIAQCARMFYLQEQFGHQAVGPRGGDGEAGAPDPHAEIWAVGAYFALHEALHLPPGQSAQLVAAAARWLRKEWALSAAFASPAGVIAMPCTRARYLNQGPPSWQVRSQCLRIVSGKPLLPKPFLRNNLAYDILHACRDLMPSLRIATSGSIPKLPFPIQRWNLPDGGFAACIAPVAGMNDPLCWVVVDSSGKVTDYPKDASVPFPSALVAGLSSVWIGAGGDSVNPTPDAGSSPVPPVPLRGPGHWSKWHGNPARREWISGLQIGEGSPRVADAGEAVEPPASPSVEVPAPPAVVSPHPLRKFLDMVGLGDPDA